MARIGGVVRIGVARAGILRLRRPPEGFWPLGLTLLLSNQPLGSSATLMLMLALAGVLSLCYRLPARPVGNCAVLLGFYFGVHLWNRLYGDPNFGLFLLYSGYAAACAAYFLVIRKVVGRMSPSDLDTSIALLLGMDLAINFPTILLQVAVHGVGDYIGGLSGILSSGSLSQGRTNTVRAGLLMVLAFARFSRRRDLLSAASAGFNLTVLVIALSMTTILSAMTAGMVVILFGKGQSHRLAKLIAVAGIFAMGTLFNYLKYGVSSAHYLLALGYHFEFTPKLNIYLHILENHLPYHPWVTLVGDSLGSFMNRFAILFNFENYSRFPFKAQLSEIFHSTLTRDHLIDRYNLEKGIMGQSILGVPWNSGLGLILEAGLVGIVALAMGLRGFCRGVLKQRSGVLGSGQYFLAFFLFNLLFDVYLEYPEVLFPFLSFGLLLAAQARADSIGREGDAHHADLRESCSSA